MSIRGASIGLGKSESGHLEVAVPQGNYPRGFPWDEPASRQNTDLVSSMATLGFLQFVTGPTHQVGHTLDLIFGVGLDVDLIAANRVPWSDHFTLKTRLCIPPHPL